MLSSSPPQSPNPPSPSHAALPPFVYRVQVPKSRTAYAFNTGLRAKNQTTILNTTRLISQFTLAHINEQTNISSPLIALYDNQAHAERVAYLWAERLQCQVMLITIDTKYLGRGPVFWARDIIHDREKTEWLHTGELLVTYQVPVRALLNEVPIGKDKAPSFGAVGSH